MKTIEERIKEVFAETEYANKGFVGLVILELQPGIFAQHVGQGMVVLHDANKLNLPPEIGKIVVIQYDGQGYGRIKN